MMMQERTLFIALLLSAPFIAGCVGGDAEERPDLPDIATGSFTVGSFVQGLERHTGGGLVAARVSSFEVQWNQTRVSLAEWRSFERNVNGCELLSTMVYEADGKLGGFLVHREKEPCPVALAGLPTVAELVALVDRVHITTIRDQALDGAPVFTLSVAGYCGYRENEDGQSVFVWDGRWLVENTGDVRCGPGSNTGLTLVANLPATPGKRADQAYVVLEQVPPIR